MIELRRLLSLPLLLLFIAAPALARTTHEHAAPEFTLPTPSGTVSLHDLRGKVVYVDFWASWCGPCRASFPWMRTIAERYEKEGLVVVSVNLDKERAAANRFLDQFTVPFTVAFDPAGRTAEEFGVQAMPSSFVVSRTGKVVYAHQGFELSKADALEQHIREALSQ